MSLNPITALSEQLQKLINEHGSAAILRDHLALFKDQVVLLEKENARLVSGNSELTTKETVLRGEKEILEAKIEQLTKDNEELRSKIQKYEQSTNQTTHKIILDDHKVNILKLLFNAENMATSEIAESLNINLQLANFHIEELCKLEMVIRLIVSRMQNIEGGRIIKTIPTKVSGCTIAQRGRKYLVDCGEIA